jgi:probable rRNA maturation factor
MSIEIANLCPEIRPARAALRRLIGGVLKMEGRGSVDVTLILAADPTLRDLNRRFRRIDRATDVISFEPEPEDPGSMPAEIYVSMDRVRVQARRYRTTPQAELARLLVHGSLHVLGHDHRHASERARMRRRERECLRALYSPAFPLYGETRPR